MDLHNSKQVPNLSETNVEVPSRVPLNIFLGKSRFLVGEMGDWSVFLWLFLLLQQKNWIAFCLSFVEYIFVLFQSIPDALFELKQLEILKMRSNPITELPQSELLKLNLFWNSI